MREPGASNSIVAVAALLEAIFSAPLLVDSKRVQSPIHFQRESSHERRSTGLPKWDCGASVGLGGWTGMVSLSPSRRPPWFSAIAIARFIVLSTIESKV